MYTSTLFRRLKHISLHEGHKSVFVGYGRNAGDTPFWLVQEPGLSEGLTLLIAVPHLQVVNNGHMVDVLSILTQELMSVEFIIGHALLL